MKIRQDIKNWQTFFRIWGGNMRKLILIARSNMRKAKGQTAAIIVLILIAASMLDLWLMLSMDYKDNFDRYHDKLNAEHVTLVADIDNPEFVKFITQTLENDNRTASFRFDNCLNMPASFDYNGGSVSLDAAFIDKSTALTRSIGKSEIVEEGDYISGVYLPLLYKTDDIDIGKSFEISIGGNKKTYTVCGFFNSVMMGSHNCSLTEIILTDDKYKELDTLGYAFKSTICSVQLKDKLKSDDFEAKLKTAVSDKYPELYVGSNSYELVRQSRYISQMICSGIVSAMSFFVLLIALIVISSNIVNYIQVNMQSLGALKAVGYTSRQLILSLLLQFLGLTFIAAIVGIGISYCLFPAINEMMIRQTGIPYAMHFLPLPFVITFIILCAAVTWVVCFATRRIKKIEPITALRAGILTHNFKRNHIPLEKTNVSINFALAFKTTLSGVKHNITICITMIVLSLVIVFAGMMTRNMIMDMQPFIDLIVGETADSCINVQAETENDFFKEMDADSRVEKVYLYNSLNVWHVGGVELMATICDDFAKVNNQNVVFNGRFPKFDNEIVIAAKYAKEQGLEIGDEIEITANGRQEKYLITGFTQISNNLGKDCLLTRAGYERLGTLTNASYYLNLSDGTDIDAFNSEVKEKFEGNVNTVFNIQTVLEGTASVYVSLMTIIVIAIIVLSVIIIAFVLYLLVRTMLNNKIKDYGILKALGFTTNQLILQTALSFMPATIISTVVGLIICSLIINPLTSLFLSGIGVVKCSFIVPAGFIVVAGIGLVIVAFMIACLLSLRIKKITPRELLSGE